MTAGPSRRRAGVLLGLLLISLLGLGLRLGYVQGVRSDEFADIAERQRLRTLDLPATRGSMYDREGRELAISVPARTVYANPRQVQDPEGTARVLAPILGMPAAKLAERLHQERGFVYLARRVDVETAARIDALELVGVGLLDEPRRVYPGGELAANVLGFVGTDGEGLAGLELAYEGLLGGRSGYRVLEQDPFGRWIPQGTFQEEPPVSGADLVLTIDRDLQHAAAGALRRAVEETGAKGGTVVAVDPRTGEILAMANRPTFDPSDLSDLQTETARNRAVTDVFEPGSVNKLVTAAAAIEEGIVAPDTSVAVPERISVGGREFRDVYPAPSGALRFDEVIARSSNVGTIRVALDLGPERLNAYLSRFGYGRPPALGFPGEAAGSVPEASQWSTSLPTMAMGQGLSASPLQVAMAYAAVANGGVRVGPKLLSGWVDSDGGFHGAQSSRTERVISQDTARELRHVLERAVVDGTGERAQIPGYAVGGKTGTAQKPSPDGGYSGHMAAFVGFVPVSEPEIVIGVVLDEPSPIWGGVVAAPVFREVGQAAVRVRRIPPSAPGDEPADPGGPHPEGEPPVPLEPTPAEEETVASTGEDGVLR